MNVERKATRRSSLREKSNYAQRLFLLASILLMPAFLWAEPTIEKSEKIDPKKIIFEHIEDSYEWHIFTWGETHVSIPLPVIVRAHNGTWHCFLSSRLAHGAEYNNFQLGDAESPNKGKVVETIAEGKEYRPIDLSITKTTLGIVLSCIILLSLILPLARWHRKHDDYSAPGGFLGALDSFILDLNNQLIKPCVGKHHQRYSPYLLTAFFFIFINNLMGLVPLFPGGANVTGNIAVTMILALFTFFMVNLFGSKAYWREVFWPDVPLWMKLPLPLMPIIEIFGVITKPFALMIRLFANMMAGHAVILGLTCLIFITASMGPIVNTGMTVVAVFMSIFMNCLELLVAYIQAYVFTMLSAVFIGLSNVEHKQELSIKRGKVLS